MFAGVKGVGDVLLFVEQGVDEFSGVKRASMTCLLGWTWSWVLFFFAELFAVVMGVGEVLAGRGPGCLFLGVKGVDDVLA